MHIHTLFSFKIYTNIYDTHVIQIYYNLIMLHLQWVSNYILRRHYRLVSRFNNAFILHFTLTSHKYETKKSSYISENARSTWKKRLQAWFMLPNIALNYMNCKKSRKYLCQSMDLNSYAWQRISDQIVELIHRCSTFPFFLWHRYWDFGCVNYQRIF